MKCGGCGAPVTAAADICWYCNAPLCWDCFEEVGHCGHPEAAALNQAASDRQSGDPLLPRPWVRAEVDEWAASFDGPRRGR